MAYLIFDYDGTIFESMSVYAPAVIVAHEQLVKEKLLKPRGITDEELRGYLGLTTTQMWESFAPQLSVQDRARGARIVGDELTRRIMAGKARLYDNAVEVLTQLRQAGHRLIYLSNCSKDYMELHERTFGLHNLFHEMYCCEEFGWISKPQIVSQLMLKWKRYEDKADNRHLIFEKCDYKYEHQNGNENENRNEHAGGKDIFTIAIGDRYKDMEIAEQCNIPAIWCAYGYGTADEGRTADKIAYQVMDIPECVNNIIAARLA